ncbi:hypothetical protein RJ639_001404 [Escallonia herrerae]|uniref:SLH domain-containing protein n=1 Tax=Escallonia herrerae TaxID=1293975 RepID=A0AA88X7C5_9ASTE|nr:hypothetical protein RJ639_001404 [Escallonia herrerae]
MCSPSVPITSLYPTNNRCKLPTFNATHPFSVNHLTFNHRRSSSLCASIADQNLELSWLPPAQPGADDCKGWAVVEAPKQNKKKGFVFRFRSPLQALHGILMPSGSKEGSESEVIDSYVPAVEDMSSEESSGSVSDVVSEVVALDAAMLISLSFLFSVFTEKNHYKVKEGRVQRILLPIAVDSTQHEALLMLKKLKIIEDEVKADKLCTRREYARWLVRANTLQRNLKYRIFPSVALSGSTVAAFDDVGVEDPDFESIQSLAEAGVILSKLSGKKNFDLDDSKSLEGVNFYPERYISRQDLISWKAKLEYEVMPGVNEEISRNKLGFLDVRDISSEALVELFMDMLAGNKSITRKVFGQGKRFQPSKPSTNAQAAVTLTSGRMTEAIHSELLRLEAENFSRQMAMDEIRSDLLERGDIQRFWDKKLEDEKSRGLAVERAYLAAVHDCEQEMIVQKNTSAKCLRQKAAIDCQKQLLFSLKEEVNETSETLAGEKATYTGERHTVESMLSDLQAKHEGLLDAKSVLEAEIEALRILRSWVEEEARKSQARAKVLEEVGRRWKWGEQS